MASIHSFVKNLSFKTLRNIFAGVTIVGSAGLLYAANRDQKFFYNSKVIVDAIEIARENEDLKKLLGQPIKGGKVDFRNKKINYKTDENAHFEVPLNGRFRSAIMVVNAIKIDEQWVLKEVNIKVTGKESSTVEVNLFTNNDIKAYKF